MIQGTTTIKKKKDFVLKQCAQCGQSYGPDNFTPTKSWFYPDGYLPVCNSCLKEYLREDDFSWQRVSKVCQWADIPFVPRKFEELHSMNGDDVFPIYGKVFLSEEYQDLGWEDYFNEFKRLQREAVIEDELPAFAR